MCERVRSHVSPLSLCIVLTCYWTDLSPTLMQGTYGQVVLTPTMSLIGKLKRMACTLADTDLLGLPLNDICVIWFRNGLVTYNILASTY